MQRVRRQRRRVVLVELDERAHQVGCACVRSGVCVGLEFVLARVQARQRLQEEPEHRRHQKKQQ
jgi:hypothetical protein